MDVTVTTASDMLQNLVSQVPAVMQLVTAVAYVAGFLMVIRGVMLLKHFGESRTQMSSEHSLKGPIMLLVVGSLLIYLPSSVQVAMSTFWSTPNPYGYLKEADKWSDFIKDVFLVIQLFGTIAFIRGLIVLSHLSKEHTQQGELAKGLTHVIGGMLCINIYQFTLLIKATLGIELQ